MNLVEWGDIGEPARARERAPRLSKPGTVSPSEPARARKNLAHDVAHDDVVGGTRACAEEPTSEYETSSSTIGEPARTRKTEANEMGGHDLVGEPARARKHLGHDGVVDVILG